MKPTLFAATCYVNEAFAELFDQGYRFARPVQWKKPGSTYWIQWTLKQPGTAVLWAFDPAQKKAVEILQVRDK